jgi:phospholipase C
LPSGMTRNPRVGSTGDPGPRETHHGPLPTHRARLERATGTDSPIASGQGLSLIRDRTDRVPMAPQGPIEHVVVIFKEKHCFDNYLGTFAGANVQPGPGSLPPPTPGKKPAPKPKRKPRPH